MRKYIGLMITVVGVLLIGSSWEIKYQSENKIALSGEYIKDRKVALDIALHDLAANNLKDPQARALELKVVEEMKRKAVEPPHTLNRYEFYKQYSGTFFGGIGLMLLSASVMLSFMFFIKFYCIEQEEKERMQKTA